MELVTVCKTLLSVLFLVALVAFVLVLGADLFLNTMEDVNGCEPGDLGGTSPSDRDAMR